MPSSLEWERRPSGRQSSGIRLLLGLLMRSPHSAFLQLCFTRQIQQTPAFSIFSSTQVKCHHISAWSAPHQPPQTNRWEPPKPGARGRGCGHPRRAHDQRAQGGLLTPRPRSVASSLSVPPWVFCSVTLLQPRGTPARVQSRSFFGTAPTATRGSRAPWRSRCGGTAGAAQVARGARRAHSDAAPEL